MIFTFYSYKGGVGRSLALAHVAYAFAERGLRVLAVDFDLEAPGLERYCVAGRESVRTAREHPGLVDLIMSYRRTLTSTAAFEERAFRDWKQYVMTVRNPVTAEGGWLDLMTAGARGSPEQLRNYALTVRTFDWLDFFHNWNGDAFFKWLRDEWTRVDIGYDVVLVDSRTGVTEMGGVCAYQLADVAVLLCAPNEQNLDGTLDVMRDFGSPGVLGLRGGRPLKLLAVPTRLERHHPLRETFLERFAELLGPPSLGPDVPVSYADLALSYLPSFAIAEPVVGGPVETATRTEREAFETLTASMRKLADALTLLADPGSRLGRQSAGALAALRGEKRSEAVALRADTSRRSAGYDFFIDCGADDAKAAHALAGLLRDRDFEVFLDTASLPAASAWSAEIERALDYSACLLVCFGKASTSGPRTSLLKRARGSVRSLALVPVLLPGGSEGVPHSFGLEDHQVVDLREGIDAASVEPLFDARRRASGEGSRREAVVHPNPYRGALPYGEDDSRFLAGRDDEIRQLLEGLDSAAVVWLDGAAKVGKSSLVLAGVLPELRARAAAAAAAPRIRVHDASLGLAWPTWSEPEAARTRRAAKPVDELIVIDHCDDFTAAPTDDARRLRDAALRILVAGTGHRRKLLIVARSPGVADANGVTADFTPDREMRRFTLRRLDGTAWRLALTEPAQKAGHLLENGLAERLTEGAGAARNALFQAQLGLAALWESRRDGWLTNRALDGLGHLAGVFKRHLDACLAAYDEADRRAAVVLLEALCQLESKDGVPLATPLPWSQARTPALLAAVDAERLRDRLAAEGLIDVWHDDAAAPAVAGLQVALARHDARSYFDDATWAAESDFMAWRGRIGPALLQWRRGGAQPSDLLPDSALVEAAQWQRLRHDALTAAELDFVETSLDALRLRSPSPDTRGATAVTPAHAAVDDAALGAVAPLRIDVLNGDLRFVAGPLLVGHYRSVGLSGSEAVADRQLAGTLSKTLASGMYPDRAGAHVVVDNLRPNPDNPLQQGRPAAIIVVGLGEEGRLRSAELIQSVRQAVLAFIARQAADVARGSGGLTLSATLMGSGAVGVSTGSSAQLVVQGVQEANRQSRARGAAIVEHLQFVELYHDRASEAWRALRHQSIGQPRATTLGFGVLAGTGALRRALASSYRGAAYDVISATSLSTDGQPTIEFGVDTTRAHTEIRARMTQGALLRDLAAKGSNEVAADSDIGRTLSGLLVPAELEVFLGGTHPLVLEVDAGTAGLPWELIDTVADAQHADPRPWAVRTKMVRKLRTVDPAARPIDTSAEGILVIAEPLTDPALYPRLPGARAEGEAVARLLADPSTGFGAARVRALSTDADALAVIGALFERPYRLLHLTGHGFLGPGGGVVLSGAGTGLGANEIQSVRTVPELVFVNTCHQAANPPGGIATTVAYDRAAFAASCAEDLLLIGVRCVVCAGWAVEAGPAVVFATAFYAALLQGARFNDAVGVARQAAWQADPRGLTWAAFQCYGDPDWTYQAGVSGPDPVAPTIASDFAEIASPVDLVLALETIAVRATYGAAPASIDRMRFLEAQYAPVWGRIGAVAEAFGLAYACALDFDRAIDWYRSAFAAHDGSASFRVAEQLGNLLARRGAARADLSHGRADLESAITHLGRLVAMQPTIEREMLLASAWKRLARRLSGERADGDELEALRATALHYGNAERMARSESLDHLAYASKNAIGAELRLALLQGRTLRLDAARLAATDAALSKTLTEAPDFWSAVAPIEFRMLVACARQRLAPEAAALVHHFHELHARVASVPMWNSVHEEARFTLEPYAHNARPAEKRAASLVLETLRKLLG